MLGFEGAALGEAARSLRDAGYAGLILAVDDDRAAVLAGGRALDGALILSDAFVPLPGLARRPLRPRVRGPPRPAPVALRGERLRDRRSLLAEAAERSRRQRARRDRLTAP